MHQVAVMDAMNDHLYPFLYFIGLRLFPEIFQVGYHAVPIIEQAVFYCSEHFLIGVVQQIQQGAYLTIPVVHGQ
jgi:hypothetical protein